MNRWQMNKLGLVDFWYYDFEEFELEDGKLLLRGTNGSGKSVTMQSFIPLLLDGNKSPSRLDPFGTTSRRIENYLLDENTDEKTAYLYIEFKRQDTENYMTIGMGMKAIKNKPLQSWYFGITDNRRVGIEFPLYREGRDKIALTKKQLENAIGGGGFYTESQKQYMAKVNELLFGFETIDQYEELLDLLISVRSPKLSKDFKPTRIYEILKQSLKVLSEEDLRPMSEAMENMDNLVGRLEEYKEAQGACNKINTHYMNYNKYSLVRKSVNVVEAHRMVKDLENKLKEYITEHEEKKVELCKTREALEATKQLLAQIEKQYEELNNGEVIKIEKDLQERKKWLEENVSQTKQKEEKLDEKKEKERDLRRSRTKYEDKYEATLKEVNEHLEVLEEICEEIYFEEGKYIQEELKKDLKEYQFKPVYISVDRYREKLKLALKEILLYESIKKEEEKLLEEKDEANKAKQILKEQAIKLEELLVDEKENYKVKINEWQAHNELFKLPKSGELFRKVEEVERMDEVNKIDYVIKDVLSSLREEWGEKIYIQTREAEKINQEINDLEGEIKRLKEIPDIEPQKSEEIRGNRKRLTQASVPFIPFYKAIDFKENISEQLRGYLEGALGEMGLLDGLIVNQEHIHQALQFEGNEYDKYLLPKDKGSSSKLGTYLVVDQGELNHISAKRVQQILDSIGIEEEDAIYIDEEGYYQLGILKGRAYPKHEVKYIGSSARKRHREDVIRQKEEGLKEKQQYLLEIEVKIVALKEKQNILNKEYEERPSTIDILEGIKLISQNEQQLEVAQKNVLKVEESYFAIQKELLEQKSKVFTYCEVLKLPHTSPIMQMEIDNLEKYRNILGWLERDQGKIINHREVMGHLEESIEEVLQDIDNLYYEINQLKRKYMMWQNEVTALEMTLQAMNIDDVREQITKCIELRATLPPQKDAQIDRISRLEEQIDRLKQVIEEETCRKEKLHQEYNEKINIFEQEYSLGYVEEATVDESINKCKRLAKEEGVLKKTKEEYTNSLMVSMRDQSAHLKEFNVQSTLRFEGIQQSRIDLVARIDGKEVSFNILGDYIRRSIEELQMLISEEERKVFEEVLINTISSKITSKIYLSKQWVNKINKHMESMNTSSSLRLSLKWVPKKADAENQLDITQLLELLERGDRCNEEDFKKLAKHFADKVKETLRMYEGTGENRNYHTIIKEVLDYRNWYEFKLFYMKNDENRKELTNTAFFQFSGGEKAMSMYVPLFSAVYARYDSCKPQCPRIVAMDEAFAGVDENNIRDMFKILKELNLDYILNSQALWGDYDTVDHLAISEIIRDMRDNTVFVMRYKWNGKERVLVE